MTVDLSVPAPQPNPSTGLDLDEIEADFADPGVVGLRKLGTVGTGPLCRLVAAVPALVAEVRRLREEVAGHERYEAEAERQFSEAADEGASVQAELDRLREALQAANADWETRVEYGRKIGDGWVHEHRGIKYASHQRTVHFRVDEAVLIDHWTYTDHRHPVEGCTHDRHDLTTQGALNAALDGETNGDPYTMSARLCDDDGMVSHERVTDRRLTELPDVTYLGRFNIMRVVRHQLKPLTEPFGCTGSAHIAGQHIRCTSPAHDRPRDYSEVLRGVSW